MSDKLRIRRSRVPRSLIKSSPSARYWSQQQDGIPWKYDSRWSVFKHNMRQRWREFRGR